MGRWAGEERASALQKKEEISVVARRQMRSRTSGRNKTTLDDRAAGAAARERSVPLNKLSLIACADAPHVRVIHAVMPTLHKGCRAHAGGRQQTREGKSG